VENAPLIDVDPAEDDAKPKGGCFGCLLRLLPIVTIFLVLLCGALLAAGYFWGRSPEEQASGKTGFAGVMEKIVGVVKGGGEQPSEQAVRVGAPGGSGGNANATTSGGQTPAEGESALGNAATAATSGVGGETGAASQSSAGNNGVSSTDEADDAGAQTGNQGSAANAASDSSSPSPSGRGGSVGGAEGAIEVTTDSQSRRYIKSRGTLATSGSNLTYEIIYQESGGQLHYRLFVMPYDSLVDKMFQANKGEFTMVFANAERQRLLPVDGAHVVGLSSLTAFEARGQVAGWVTRGIIPLSGRNMSDVHSFRLGWDLDQDLGDLLKDLGGQRPRR